MSMTRAQLRDHIALNLNRTDLTTRINQWLDLGASAIGQRHNFREMLFESSLSLALNDLSKALPTSPAYFQVVEARLIDGTSSFPIELRTKQWFTQRFPNVTADTAGKPAFAYEEGGSLYFAPKADAAYTVKVTCSKLPIALAADTSTFLVPHAENALISWATYRGFLSIQMYQDAQAWQQVYEQDLAIAIRADKAKDGVVVRTDDFGALAASASGDRNPLSPFNKGGPGY